MGEPSPPTNIVHFGIFQIDLKARELHKAGVKVKLQEQPFRVLALLVERAGQVVTREELRQTVWASDTFVDFDHGLNATRELARQSAGDRELIGGSNSSGEREEGRCGDGSDHGPAQWLRWDRAHNHTPDAPLRIRGSQYHRGQSPYCALLNSAQCFGRRMRFGVPQPLAGSHPRVAL